MGETMPSSTTELIKSKLDVVAFLRGYLTLTPAGRNFRGLCPFHKEKTPSFMVSPERQSWHCFGCGIGGDIFTFVMKYENIEFGEALRMLAEKAGVELRHENPAEYRYSGLLYDLNNAAKEFFKRALAAAPVAKEYLASRGLTQETVEMFEIGWAPNESEVLSMQLLNAGSSPQDIIQAGLSIKTDRGLMLDRFRGRIMFPIHNHTGKVVGFTGRILPQLDKGDTGKYVNSPETPIFQKSKLLYGFWKSKEAIREAKIAVLVEGQMDFLMSFQSGVRNIVASSGTALTADHLVVLHRLAEELIINYDSDTAGAEAAVRAIDLAEASDFSVKVATVEGFKDAADAAKADPGNVRRTIEAAVPAPEFYFKKYLPHFAEASRGEAIDRAAFGMPEGLRNLRTVLQKLRTIASPVQQEFWFKKLADLTGIAEKTLEAESKKTEGEAVFVPIEKTEEASKRQVSRAELLFEELVSIALAKNDLSLLDDCALFLDPTQKEILRILASGKRKSDDPAIDALIDLIVLRETPAEPWDDEILKLKTALQGEYLKERRKIIAQAIKNAEARHDERELAAALEEMKNLPAGE
jgi:DNA primase